MRNENFSSRSRLQRRRCDTYFYKTVREFEGLQQHEVEIVFINDGSKDATESIINAIAVADPLVVPLSFTRNFGKEPALFAGLDHATGEAIIPIDVDLQDPIEVIPHLIEKWQAGADMVLAKRSDRSTDGRLKRKTAEWFYKLHNKISNPQIEENVGDFRLMSRDVVENIKLMPERNLFMKGVLSWVGGRTDVVEYARAERVAGDSKFNGWKLWNLALEGITSFSTFPLRMWTYIGLFVAGLGLHLWRMDDRRHVSIRQSGSRLSITAGFNTFLGRDSIDRHRCAWGIYRQDLC